VNIALIGVGQIGSRHLQALSNLKGLSQIWVIDISEKSLEVAKDRFLQMPESKNYKGQLHFGKTLAALPVELDVVIVTSTASNRKKITTDLLEKNTVRYLVLEKVLFQDPADYESIDLLLKEKGVKTFVNFPRRMFSVYKELREALSTASNIQFVAAGSNWGLACNGLHLIDLFNYLCNSSSVDISFNMLDPKIVESKRKGYLEVNGTLTGKDSKGNSFSISCYKEGDAPMTIHILSDTFKAIVFEAGANSHLYFATHLTDWAWKKKTFSMPYQSELSHKIIEDLDQKGNCELTTFVEAKGAHLIFIKGLIDHFNHSEKDKYSVCPIT